MNVEHRKLLENLTIGPIVLDALDRLGSSFTKEDFMSVSGFPEDFIEVIINRLIILDVIRVASDFTYRFTELSA